MALLQGFVCKGMRGGIQNPHVSADLTAHATETEVSWPTSHSRIQDAGNQAVTRHPAQANGRVIACVGPRGYSDDYYHRIHISPGEVALGNVVSTQVSTVRIWNAFLIPQQVVALEGVEEGLQVTPPAALPMTLGGLRETDWLVAVTPDGPSTLDAIISWVFSAAPSARLRITGNRIVPWGFVPNWGQPVVERLSWLTDVLGNPRGTEQRRSLRVAPRKAWQANFVMEGAERALFDLAMAGWGRRVWSLPVWVDAQQLTAPLPAGSSVIACDTVGRDFREGGLALLRGETAFDTEAVEIQSITTQAITLQRVTQAAWPAGTRLYPLRSARLAELPETTRRTDRLLVSDCSFELVEPVDWPGVLPATLYKGQPVLVARPDESEDLTHSYERLVLTLDNATGIPAATDTAGKGFVLQQHRWLLVGRQEHSAWRSLLYALRGRATAVWIPTHAQDLMPAGPLTGSLLKVQRVGYSRFGLGQLGRQDIRIELQDGSVLMRRITAAVENGPTEELVVDADFPGVIQPDQVARISYMALCRLASDDVELEHLTDQDGVARCAVTLRGVRDDLEAV